MIPTDYADKIIKIFTLLQIYQDKNYGNTLHLCNE